MVEHLTMAFIKIDLIQHDAAFVDNISFIATISKKMFHR